MKPAFYIFAVLLFSLVGCRKEPMEIPKPDINIEVDWKKYIYQEERPVDESAYPPCDELPMMFNPAHPDNYESRYLDDTYYSGLSFQSGENPLYAVYGRYVTYERDQFGVISLIGRVVLLDLRNGDTTSLGVTNGWPSIGGVYVIFPSWGQYVVYNLAKREKQVIEGNIEGVKVSPRGKKAWFRSNSESGELKKWHSYVFDIQSWKPLLEEYNDEMYQASWLSDTDFVFVKTLDPSLYIFNMEAEKSEVFQGPFENHFGIFTSVSSNLKYAYGTKTYVRDLETGYRLFFDEEYDQANCETKGWRYIYPLPDGQLLVERYYRPIDTTNQIVYFQQELRLFDADGTNERMVTLLLK